MDKKLDRKQLVKKLWEVANSRDEILLLMQDCENFIKSFNTYVSPRFDGEGKAYCQDDTLCGVLDLEYYKGKLQGLSFRLRQCEKEFEGYLSYLESIERAIFILRYLHKCTWEKVGSGSSYSRIQVIRIHNKALDKILKAVTATEESKGK